MDPNGMKEALAMQILGEAVSAVQRMLQAFWRDLREREAGQGIDTPPDYWLGP
jgi:hypothetical protein